jgi:hypothetical protein
MTGSTTGHQRVGPFVDRGCSLNIWKAAVYWRKIASLLSFIKIPSLFAVRGIEKIMSSIECHFSVESHNPTRKEHESNR